MVLRFILLRGSSLTGTTKKKEFQVQLAFYCDGCRQTFEEEFIKSLPLEIARTSSCSCGATLSLKEYCINRVGDDLEFEGVYVCDECNTKTRKLIDGIKRTLYDTWRKTKKVVVAPGYLIIEKEPE